MPPVTKPTRFSRQGEMRTFGIGSRTRSAARSRLELSVRFYICCVDFDRNRLPDQIDREYEPRFQGVLAHQTPDNALERTALDLHHHALFNHRAGIVLQFAADQEANAFKFVVGNRGGLPLE